jgi:hypothetical protein
MPNKIKSIGDAAFKGCKAIKAVDFSATKIQTMGESAFEGCSGITSLNFGNTLSTIPQRAFADCKELAVITFPVVGGNRTTIGAYAFSGCFRLKQLVLPQFVQAVDENAFQSCTNLTRIEIRCDSIELAQTAFPVENRELVIIATPGSKGDDYAAKYGKQADKDKYYTYTVEDIINGKFCNIIGVLWHKPDFRGADPPAERRRRPGADMRATLTP